MERSPVTYLEMAEKFEALAQKAEDRFYRNAFEEMASKFRTLAARIRESKEKNRSNNT